MTKIPGTKVCLKFRDQKKLPLISLFPNFCSNTPQPTTVLQGLAKPWEKLSLSRQQGLIS